MRILDQQEEVRNIARKSRVLMGVIFVSLLLLSVRIGYLQLHRGGEHLQKSKNNYLLREKIFPARGDILTADGRTLATTSAQFRIQILPAFFAGDEVEESSMRLASILGLPDRQVGELVEFLSTCRGRCRYTPVTVRDELPKNEMLRLSSYLTDVPGVTVSSSYRRVYPLGVTAAHLTGYVGRISRGDLSAYPGYDPESFVGKTGIERSWERELHGAYGELWQVIDHVGRRIEKQDRSSGEVPPTVPARKGRSVQTAVLSYLQEEAEAALGERAGAVVMMDIHTGDILALYSNPSYDPNLLSGRRISPSVWLEYSESVLRPLTNKAIQSSFFPGSTFKVIPALAGLEYGVVTPHTSFLCTGCLMFDAEVKCCWNKWGHAYTAFRRGLKESCDIYFYFLSERLGHHRLTEFSRLFHVGRRTGIDLAEEEDGILPTTEWFNHNHRGQTLNKGYTMNLAIGQGDVRMTPLQLAVAYAAIANGGLILRPRIVSSLIDDQGRREPMEPEVLRAVQLKEKNRREVMNALWAVVNEEGGTAFRYADHTIPAAAGKTGTSQIISKTERRQIDIVDEDRRSMTADDALFVGMFPARRPEVVAVAVVESGAHGGEAATPIAYRLFKSYYYRGRGEE